MMSLRRSPVTAGLLITIATVFVFEIMGGAMKHDPVLANAVLANMGAIVPGLFPRHEYWRLLAAMFLHAGWLHVLSNSWALYQLGGLYELMFGSARFTAIYFISGICASVASAIHLQHASNLSVGASGAVFGVLGAFIFSIRRSPQWRHEPWTKSLLSQLVFWIVVNLALGASIEVIDNTAHVAGLIVGLILGFIPHRVPPPPPNARVIDVMPYHVGNGG
jgi:rhomboid protease GluP